jgi:hypothetical protein
VIDISNYLKTTVKKIFKNDKVSAIEITFGEDGIWEEALLDDEFYHDASPFGDLRYMVLMSHLFMSLKLTKL